MERPRMGLQRSVSEIFQGISIPGKDAPADCASEVDNGALRGQLEKVIERLVGTDKPLHSSQDLH